MLTMIKYHEIAAVPENCEREFCVFWSSAAEPILPETHCKKVVETGLGRVGLEDQTSLVKILSVLHLAAL